MFDNDKGAWWHVVPDVMAMARARREALEESGRAADDPESAASKTAMARMRWSGQAPLDPTDESVAGRTALARRAWYGRRPEAPGVAPGIAEGFTASYEPDFSDVAGGASSNVRDARINNDRLTDRSGVTNAAFRQRLASRMRSPY